MASSDHDDRVDPMHARKFVAAVQNAVPDAAHPVYLRIEANAGHGGADGVAAAIQAQADIWGFVMSQLGVTPVTK
jgi:prolyl oligopeptidase